MLSFSISNGLPQAFLARGAFKKNVSAATSGSSDMTSLSTRVKLSIAATDSAAGASREILNTCANIVQKWSKCGGSSESDGTFFILDY